MPYVFDGGQAVSWDLLASPSSTVFTAVARRRWRRRGSHCYQRPPVSVYDISDVTHPIFRQVSGTAVAFSTVSSGACSVVACLEARETS